MALLGGDLHGGKQTKVFEARLLAAAWLVGLAMFLLLSRLYAVQVLRGAEFSDKGRRNFVNQVQVPHDRGIIYDRNGRILVDNRPSLNLQVTPAFLGKRAAARQTLKHLAQMLQMGPEELTRVTDQVESRLGLERFRPVTVRRDLDPEQVEAIGAERGVFLLDGVDIAEGRRRTYHYGALAAHLLGYVSEIDARALDAERARGNPNGYELGDIIGRDGIESTYEAQLRGVDGTDKVVVDAKGRRQRGGYVETLLKSHRRLEPKPGHNVYLTLDLDLQLRAEESFARHGKAGSVVALDPKTGAILVLASVPAYDANIVSGSFTRDEQKKLDQDPLHPWLNRSISGQYVPGSTFKVVTALAAIKARAAGRNEHINCPGHYKMGRHVWRCYKDSGHGPLDLRDAIKVSCDVYFYTLGARLGIDPIAAMARLLSFGARTGIALRGEQSGIVPDEAWHNRIDAATGGYQKGMTINTSIGQGSLAVTPLQLAVAYAAVGHGKKAFVPQLVQRIESADFRVTKRSLQTLSADPCASAAAGAAAAAPAGDNPQPPTTMSTPAGHLSVCGEPPLVIEGFTAKTLADLDVPAADLAQVRAGLEAAAGEAGGTAFRARSLKVSMAAKTGTAQVVKLGAKRLKSADIDYFERDHAWFVGYAPAHDPQIVVAVINEHAGHGGSASAPIAVDVIDSYFSLKEKRAAEASPQAAEKETP